MVVTIGVSEVVFCLAGLMAFFYTRREKERIGKNGEKIPPGPWNLPLLGYLPFLGRDPTIKFMKLQKQFGDIFSIKMGSRRVVIVSGKEAMTDLLHSEVVCDRPDFKAFSTINEGRSVSFKNYGPSYKLHRKICVKALGDLSHPSRGPLGKLLHDSGNLLCKLLGDEVGRAFDPKELIYTAVMSVVFRVSFGPDVSPECSEEFNELRQVLAKFETNLNRCAPADFLTFLRPFWGKFMEQFRVVTERYTKAVQTIIDEHKKTYDPEKHRDGLDTLIYSMGRYQERLGELGLTERDILHSVQDFVGAGTENSQQTMLWLLQHLARYTEAQEAVYRELAAAGDGEGLEEVADKSRRPYVWSFVLEVMRLKHSAPIGIPRSASEDFTYNGHFIPKGTIIMGNLRSLLMDGTSFPEPDQFRPDRFLRPDGSFDAALMNKLPIYGIGKRRCIGANLAQYELIYFTTRIVRAFRVREDPASPLTFGGVFDLVYKPDPFKIILEHRE